MTAASNGIRIFRYAELGSTNDQAKRLIEAGFCDNIAIRAERQTAGRGRGGRTWQSLKGNLACSLVASPDMPATRLSELSFVIAVALRDSIAKCLPAPHAAKLKWPNDVLIGDAKLSGILLEVATGTRSDRPSVIVGIGVNVAAAPDDLDRPAVSLQSLGSAIAADDLFVDLAERFFDRAARWQAEGLAPVLADWLDHAIGLREEIVVRTGDRQRRGVFEALDETGALVLRLPDGRTEKVTAGDVFLT